MDEESDTVEFACDTESPSFPLEDIVKILPSWKTRVVNIEADTQLLTISFIVGAKSKEDVAKWIKDFEEKTFCSYSIQKSYPVAGCRLQFKQVLYCHHNTKVKRLYDPSGGSRTRNTNCPSKMTIKLFAIKEKYRGKEKLVVTPEMPCLIHLIASHNHSTGDEDALKFRLVGDDVKAKLIELYSNGHTPSSALESIKVDIYMNYPETYEIMLADRKYCPDYNYCYYIYRKELKNKNIKPIKINSKSYSKWAEDYNTSQNDNCAEVRFVGNACVICISTPLMKRVHKNHKTSSEVVFLDSTEPVDKKRGYRVYLLLTYSDYIPLPLGLIITDLNHLEVLTQGFEMLKNLLGSDLFGGKLKGPKLFLTDDVIIDHTAAITVWTESDNLLCTFQVLQAVWRWLTREKNNIMREDQDRMFQDFKAILEASDAEECQNKYEQALSNAEKYPNYKSYLRKTYWNRQRLWALHYRDCKLARDSVHNFSEAVILLLKEKLVEFIITDKIYDLLNFIASKCTNYFQLFVLDSGHNGAKKRIFGQRLELPPLGLLDNIENLGNHVYVVPSEINYVSHIVNTEVLACTCSSGNKAKLCAHLQWISFLHHSTCSKEVRNIQNQFYMIGTGTLGEEDSNLADALTDRHNFNAEYSRYLNAENKEEDSALLSEEIEGTVAQEINELQNKNSIKDFCRVYDNISENSSSAVNGGIGNMQKYVNIKRFKGLESTNTSFTKEFPSPSNIRKINLKRNEETSIIEAPVIIKRNKNCELEIIEFQNQTIKVEVDISQSLNC